MHILFHLTYCNTYIHTYIHTYNVRFEKEWLNDAATMFSRFMDEEVRFMIPK